MGENEAFFMDPAFEILFSLRCSLSRKYAGSHSVYVHTATQHLTTFENTLMLEGIYYGRIFKNTHTIF